MMLNLGASSELADEVLDSAKPKIIGAFGSYQLNFEVEIPAEAAREIEQKLDAFIQTFVRTIHGLIGQILATEVDLYHLRREIGPTTKSCPMLAQYQAANPSTTS